MGNCQTCVPAPESKFLTRFKWPQSGSCKVLSCGFKYYQPLSNTGQVSSHYIESQTSKLAEAVLKWHSEIETIKFTYFETRGFTLDGDIIPICDGLEFAFEVDAHSGRYRRFAGSEVDIATKMLAFMGIEETIDKMPDNVTQPLYRNILQFTKMMWTTWVEEWVEIPYDKHDAVQHIDPPEIELSRTLAEFDQDLLKEVDEMLNEIEAESETYTHSQSGFSTKLGASLNQTTMQPRQATRESIAVVEFTPDSKSESNAFKLYKAQLWVFDWAPKEEPMPELQQHISRFNIQVLNSTRQCFKHQGQHAVQLTQ